MREEIAVKLSVMTLPLLPAPEIPGLVRTRAPETVPSLEDIYCQIRDAGGKYLDISSMDFQYGGEEAVVRAMEASGLPCACYLAFIPAPGITPADNAQAVEAVEQALRLGARVMMFVPSDNQEAVASMSRQAVADAFAAVLRPVTAYAAERDVTVVIEDAPHREFPMCSEAELRYLLEAVPGLKLVYDSGNMLFAGEEPIAYYDHLADYTAHAHVKEVCRRPDGSLAECRHGEGIVDFKTLFAHMRSHGFDGYMAIELAPDFTGEAPPIRERVRQAIEYLTPLCCDAGDK